MNSRSLLSLFCALTLCAGVARADTMSYVGTLQNPDNATGTFDSTDSFTVTLTLGSLSDVTLQTYGFGGGTNAAGATISPGGTDPFVGLFSGTGNGALFIDGTSLDLTNYSPGCPPANTVSNFGGTTCGDVSLTFDNLAAGTYTVLLSDGQYIPCAAIDPDCSTLGDGTVDPILGSVVSDFTGGYPGGQFCNLLDDTNGVITDCPNTSGAYALDVSVTAVPEPDSLLLAGTALLASAGLWRRWRSPRP